jgi:hypothetical protein
LCLTPVPGLFRLYDSFSRGVETLDNLLRLGPVPASLHHRRRYLTMDSTLPPCLLNSVCRQSSGRRAGRKTAYTVPQFTASAK